ncbi:MAG TPA: hypothetical protein VJ579_00510 [Candidatus Paceibacterota bacterium]|nr:hypothetical protein [Candidatus Paceibacterota bacterium]
MLRSIRFLLVSMLLLPSLAAAATSSVGIPTGGIWFSKEPFFVGDQILVNTLVFNATDGVVRGTLELLDGLTILQQKDVAVDAGDSKIVSFPVQVTRGRHAFHIRIAGGDVTGKGGITIPVKTSGDYVGQTSELKREAAISPELPVVDVPKSTSSVAVATTSAFTSKDAQGVADVVEKVLPAKVVEPVVNFAVPIIGATESFRVGQANSNTERINSTVGDLAKDIGVAKVLGITTEATSTGRVATSTLLSKFTGWSVFREGITSNNFIKSPFGYVKLFLYLLYHAVVSAAWFFYGLSAFILFKLFLYVKRLIFPVAS